MVQRKDIKNSTAGNVIFFVDDEPAVRKAVKQTLAQLEDCDVRCFQSAEECLGHLEKKRCSLLITDVNMPGMDGIGLLERVKRIRPQLPVLLITGYGDIPMAVKAVKAGAKEFIEKPFDESSFVATVKSVLQTSSIEEKLRSKVLTKTEIEILRQIAEGKSNKKIAFDASRSIRTIENHRYRIMRKLGAQGTAELVKTAIRMGLVQG